jgi:DNA-binding transcriptional MerR regulator
MFTIGEFARHGRVSVRMLRHYDATGLLRPARVDPVSSYRFYAADQLARLNRIIALKDLGFTLEQVRAMLDQQVSAEQLRGMLRLRQAELQSQLAADASRLAQVEARLRIIEMEGAMPADDIQVKRIPAVRVAELTGTAASLEPESITPVIQPLYQELGGLLGRAGLAPAGPAIAYYEDAPAGDGVLVHATLPVNADPGPVDRRQRLPLGRAPARAVPRMPRRPGQVGHRTAGADHDRMTRPGPPPLADQAPLHGRRARAPRA